MMLIVCHLDLPICGYNFAEMSALPWSNITKINISDYGYTGTLSAALCAVVGPSIEGGTGWDVGWVV